MYKFVVIILLVVHGTLSARTIIVAPNSTYIKLSDVEDLIEDGDTVLIKSGTYKNDRQVTIRKNRVTILGDAGRPILMAGNIIAEDAVNGKGILVVKGDHVTIDNIAFYDTKVMDLNGAGIRQEGCDLKVIRCLFLNNENGILCGTIPNCKTTIEYCEFRRNGAALNPGYQHNIYINNIDTLIFRFNISADATAEGHELKSRAKFNYIAYNVIANYTTDDSRSIDLPNGGISILLGNTIEQGPNSANGNIIGYGLEGLSNPGPHRLYIVNNTIVNRRSGGSLVHVPSERLDKFVMSNNALVFNGAQAIIGNQEVLNYEANISPDEECFSDYGGNNYTLEAGCTLINKGKVIEDREGSYTMIPEYEFLKLTKYGPRAMDSRIDVGAFEYVGPSKTVETGGIRPIIYPNPGSDQLTIQGLTVEEAVKIYSLATGQRMILPVNAEKVDISTLSTGIYLLYMSGKHYKFVKM
jgi:hypothetical protein